MVSQLRSGYRFDRTLRPAPARRGSLGASASLLPRYCSADRARSAYATPASEQLSPLAGPESWKPGSRTCSDIPTVLR